MKYSIMLTLLISSFLFSTVAHATSKKGSHSQSNLNHNGCKIKKITVKYSLSHLFGEPTKYGAFKWSKGGGTDSDCLTHDVNVYLEVQPENSFQSTFVKLSPIVPKAGRGYGMNSTGSPNWSEMFCDVGGSNCMDAQSAKLVMKGNYSVMGFRLSGGTETASKKEALKVKVEREKKRAKGREIEREKERQRQIALAKEQELERQRQIALEKERTRLAAIEREREWQRQREFKREKERRKETQLANEKRRKERKKFRKDSSDRVDAAIEFKNKVKEGMSDRDRRRLDEQMKLQKKLGLSGCEGIRDRVARRKCESMY